MSAEESKAMEVDAEESKVEDTGPMITLRSRNGEEFTLVSAGFAMWLRASCVRVRPSALCTAISTKSGKKMSRWIAPLYISHSAQPRDDVFSQTKEGVQGTRGGGRHLPLTASNPSSIFQNIQ